MGIVCETKTCKLLGLPKRGKKITKTENTKMDGLCFVFNALLTVHGLENVVINKSFVVQSMENIPR